MSQIREAFKQYTQLTQPALTISSPNNPGHWLYSLQQSINSSNAPSLLVSRQASLSLHELIKSTPLKPVSVQERTSLQDESALPILAYSHEEPSVQDEKTLPISAKAHDLYPVQDGPTTYGIVAP